MSWMENLLTLNVIVMLNYEIESFTLACVKAMSKSKM